MPLDIKIPHVGESITEVQIAEWLKAEGDTVQKDENVAVIDSDKTTFELPAPENGRLVKLVYKAGDTVKVGAVVAQLETNGASEKPKSEAPVPGAEAAETIASKKVEAKKAPAKEQEPAPKKPTPNPDVEPEAEVKSESEDKEPQEAKESIAQSAPKITLKAKAAPQSEPTPETEKPAEAQAPEMRAPAPAPAAAKTQNSGGREERKVPVSRLRLTVARRLVEAKQQMAMLTTFNEVDMSIVQALRKEHQEAFKQRHQAKLGIMSFFVKAAVEALKQFPQINAELRENELIYRDYFDIGAAIASDRGLVVPVLRNAERMNFAEVEKAISDFAQRARDGKLKPEELAGGTFTITNGGVFGSLFSTPIINPPQCAILGLHAIQERPVAVQGQVVIRPMMYVALSYDHRIVDGREAVQFLHRVKETIENPARMLIGI